MKRVGKLEGWKVEKLGDVSKINYGYTEKASFKEVGPKFLRITDIQDNNVDWETVPYCKIEKSELPRYILHDGDIVFARTGATTGKSFLIKNPPSAVFASYLIRLQILDLKKLLPDYLILFFQTQTYWDKIQVGISGSAQGGFNASKLAELEIPIPPLPEQQRIVSLLDETFESIAGAKVNAERNLVNARELFESVLAEIFGNGKDWEEKTLGKIAENLDSQRIPVTKRDRKEGKYPYYGASGIVDYVDEFLFDEDLLLISEDGANLLARTYPIAFSISGKTWVNNHAHVLRFEKMETQKYVEYYLNSIPLDDYVSGMAQPKLNQAMLNSIVIPLPKTLAEQRAIVARLDVLAAETKKLEGIYQSKLEGLEELKKSILQKAFTQT